MKDAMVCFGVFGELDGEGFDCPDKSGERRRAHNGFLRHNVSAAQFAGFRHERAMAVNERQAIDRKPKRRGSTQKIPVPFPPWFAVSRNGMTARIIRRHAVLDPLHGTAEQIDNRRSDLLAPQWQDDPLV